MSSDWLIGDRGAEATERICAAAAGLIARRGLTALDVDSVARAAIRADPVVVGFVRADNARFGMSALTDSEVLSAFAAELTGIGDDPMAARWIVRVVLAMVLWPGADIAEERAMLGRFIGSAFDE